VAFLAAALLAGCGTVARDAATVLAFSQSMTPGQSTAVLYRVEPAGVVTASRTAGLWRLDQGEPSGNGAEPLLAPSQAAWEQGWRVLPKLSPGRYLLRVVTSGPGDVPALDLAIRIPPNPPAVTYIGSFRVVCTAPTQSCRLVPAPPEPAEAAALVAATGGGLAAPVTALAGPYPPSFAALGLLPPATPRIRVDGRRWAAAIDWNTLIRDGGGAPPQAPGPRSDREGTGNAEMVPTSGVADGIGGALGAGAAAGGAAGGVVLLGAIAVLIVLIPVALIARAIAEDQRNRKDAQQARREAERLRAVALADEQWNPCTSAIAATLAPDSVERHLQSTLAPSRPTGRRTELPGPWEATVTRVVLRHCGTAPDSHGVEVATRWTATRPGESEPVFDAAFSRTVAGATSDPRLIHSTRPAWEVPVATEAACRPLADYCGAGGTALLLEEVVRGVVEARDAIVADR
jgi:hypothetical protein